MLPAALNTSNVYVTVVRLRGVVVTNDYNDKSIDWSSPDRLPIERCVFEPLAGEEVLDGRDAVVTRWTFFGPEDADVLSTDRLEYDGIAYDIDGSVTRPHGLGLDHTAALCRRVDG